MDQERREGNKEDQHVSLRKSEKEGTVKKLGLFTKRDSGLMSSFEWGGSTGSRGKLNRRQYRVWRWWGLGKEKKGLGWKRKRDDGEKSVEKLGMQGSPGHHEDRGVREDCARILREKENGYYKIPETEEGQTIRAKKQTR